MRHEMRMTDYHFSYCICGWATNRSRPPFGPAQFEEHLRDVMMQGSGAPTEWMIEKMAMDLAPVRTNRKRWWKR